MSTSLSEVKPSVAAAICLSPKMTQTVMSRRNDNILFNGQVQFLGYLTKMIPLGILPCRLHGMDAGDEIGKLHSHQSV